jgi:hypothetical protein
MASSKTNRYEYICVAVILQIRCKNYVGLQSETICLLLGSLSILIQNKNSANNIKFTPEIVS